MFVILQKFNFKLCGNFPLSLYIVSPLSERHCRFFLLFFFFLSFFFSVHFLNEWMRIAKCGKVARAQSEINCLCSSLSFEWLVSVLFLWQSIFSHHMVWLGSRSHRSRPLHPHFHAPVTLIYIFDREVHIRNFDEPISGQNTHTLHVCCQQMLSQYTDWQIIIVIQIVNVKRNWWMNRGYGHVYHLSYRTKHTHTHNIQLQPQWRQQSEHHWQFKSE